MSSMKYKDVVSWKDEELYNLLGIAYANRRRITRLKLLETCRYIFSLECSIFEQIKKEVFSECLSDTMLAQIRFSIQINCMFIGVCEACHTLIIEKSLNIDGIKVKARPRTKIIYSPVKNKYFKVPITYKEQPEEGEHCLNIVCQRCKKAITKCQVPKYSRINGFPLFKTPTELANVSWTEVALVRLIAPIHVTINLSKGTSSLKGNLLFIDREPNVTNVAATLPRLPQEIDILVIQPQKAKAEHEYLFCRRDVVWKMLLYLKTNSPYYKDVEISFSNLQQLPQNDFIDANTLSTEDYNKMLRVKNIDSEKQQVVEAEKDINEFLSDTGPAKDQLDEERDEYFGTTNDYQNKLLSKYIDEQIEVFSGFQQPSERITNKMYVFKHSYGNPVNTNQQGLLPKAFPATFFFLNSDFHYIERPLKPRLIELTKYEHYKHLVNLGMNHFVKDPTLVYSLLSELRKDQTQGTIQWFLKDGYNGAPPNKRAAETLYDEYKHDFTQFSTGAFFSTTKIANTPSFWNLELKKLAALVRHSNYHRTVRPLFFSTLSCAEFYWVDLFRLLYRYFLRTNQKINAKVCLQQIKKQQINQVGGSIRKIIAEHQHIINKYFVLKCKLLQEIMHEHFGLSSYYSRFEFAPSRGQIHCHSILFAPMKKATQLLKPLDKLLYSNNVEDLKAAERQVALDIETALNKDFFSLTAEHPSGRTYHGDDQTAWYNLQLKKKRNRFEIGNISFWPPPEGLLSPATSKTALKSDFFEHIHDNREDQTIGLVNNCQIHSCNNFCLRTRKNGKEYCRVNFGHVNKSLKTKTQGKKPNNFPKLSNKSGYLLFDARRDHPRIQQYSKAYLNIWRANIDMQPILLPLHEELFNISPTENILEWYKVFKNSEMNKSLLKRRYLHPVSQLRQMINYLCSYTCKKGENIRTFHEAFKRIILSEDIPQENSMKSIFMRCFSLIARRRTIPMPEALYMLQGLPFVLTSEMFVTATIESNAVRVDKETGDTIPNLRQKYLASEFSSTISYYDYVLRSNPKAIPMFYDEIEVDTTKVFKQDFCRQQLLLHKIGFDLPRKEKESVNYADVFKDFLTTSACPLFLKREIKAALYESVIYEKGDMNPFIPQRRKEKEEAIEADNIFDEPEDNKDLFDLVDKQYDEEISEAPLGYMTTFTPASDLLDNTNLLHESLKKACVSKPKQNSLTVSFADTATQEQATILTNIFAHFLRVKKQPKHSKKFLICGSAGTGKSYIINMMLNCFNHCFPNQKAVVLAPTGAAAGIINGITIDAFFDISRSKKEYAEYSVTKFKQMQQKCQQTKLIIIDEAFMVGQRLLGHVALRIEELYPTEQPLSTFVLVGDCKQLSPVRDLPLFRIHTAKTKPTNLELKGFYLYKECRYNTFYLSTPMRQKGGTFFDLLQRLRQGVLTEADKNLLRKRTLQNLSPHEYNSFVDPNNTLEAACYNNTKNASNIEYIKRQINLHILHAERKGTHCRGICTSTRIQSHTQTIFLFEGAKVKLTQNIKPEFQLFNGQKGIVQHILYLNTNGYTKTELPQLILVKFAHLTIPDNIIPHSLKPLIMNNIWPLLPQTIFCAYKNCRTCYVKQFPLEINHCDTIHSLQGATLKKEKLLIKDWKKKAENHFANILYVCLSRSQKISNVAFLNEPTSEDFGSIGHTHNFHEQNNEVLLLQDLAATTHNSSWLNLQKVIEDLFAASKSDNNHQDYLQTSATTLPQLECPTTVSNSMHTTTVKQSCTLKNQASVNSNRSNINSKRNSSSYLHALQILKQPKHSTDLDPATCFELEKEISEELPIPQHHHLNSVHAENKTNVQQTTNPEKTTTIDSTSFTRSTRKSFSAFSIISQAMKQPKPTDSFEATTWISSTQLYEWISPLNNNPEIYCFDSSFMMSFSSRKKENYLSSRKLKKLYHCSTKQWLFPANTDPHAGEHWILFHVNVAQKQITCYDSLRTRNPNVQARFKDLEIALHFLALEQDELEYLFGWTKKMINTAEQQNGFDCGIFLYMHIRHFLLHNKWQKATQGEATAFRRQLLTR